MSSVEEQLLEKLKTASDTDKIIFKNQYELLGSIHSNAISIIKKIKIKYKNNTKLNRKHRNNLRKLIDIWCRHADASKKYYTEIEKYNTPLLDITCESFKVLFDKYLGFYNKLLTETDIFNEICNKILNATADATNATNATDAINNTYTQAIDCP